MAKFKPERKRYQYIKNIIGTDSFTTNNGGVFFEIRSISKRGGTVVTKIEMPDWVIRAITKAGVASAKKAVSEANSRGNQLKDTFLP